ncbi:MAG: 2OG-Fe(II) oxygenase [Halioglobus sp.]
MSQKVFVPHYSFNPATKCYCNSGNLFCECCGDTSPTRSTPRGISIIKGFLSAQECKQFVRFAEKQGREWLKLNDEERSTEKKLVLKKDPGRVTQRVDVYKKQKQIEQWITTACTEHVEPAFNQSAQWFEEPQLLRYGPGGMYQPHSDADAVDIETQRYHRVIDRDFSVLVYLNDNYEGGGLHFVGQDYTYQPSAGDLAFFPSGNLFVHESLPILSGTKYALVSWGAFLGSPRITPQPTFRVIHIPH